MDLGLTGKVAVVAGSSRGLGRAVAEALAGEGMNLALCARDKVVLEQTAREIETRHKTNVLAESLDVTDFEAGAKFVHQAHQKFGRLDVLVTNAGGPPGGTFDDFDLDDWQRAVDLNFMSGVNLIQAGVPFMRQAGWGRIINLTSVSVKRPLAGLILSNAVRSAVIGLAKSLANELAADKITVNNICPGYTRTARVEQLAEKVAADKGASPAEVIAGWESTIPVGRLGEPSEIGALAAFLASEQAGFITGQSIVIDGGFYRGIA
ncbi:MAG: SDR family oxidoreductase [Proteobacteria bacterium]|nr:SDR family oxidoreductase [Pseudomonadota bacterium]